MWVTKISINERHFWTKFLLFLVQTIVLTSIIFRWARLLIEELTGYYTGSYYATNSTRNSLYLSGLLGGIEPPLNGKTIIVKNHGVNLEEKLQGAILIIRNPFDAIKAEWNRKTAKTNKSGHC